MGEDLFLANLFCVMPVDRCCGAGGDEGVVGPPWAACCHLLRVCLCFGGVVSSICLDVEVILKRTLEII